MQNPDKIVNFGLSSVEDGEKRLKLFEVYFDISTSHLLGTTDECDYYYSQNFNLRKFKDGTYEVTVLDPSRFNFIGNHLCSIIECSGKFRSGLMYGCWSFKLKDKKNNIICVIKGGYDNYGRKKGLWSIQFASKLNFFSLKDDEFDGDVVIHDNGIRWIYTYHNGKEIHRRASIV
jgi:hypothetical protein